MRSSLSWLVGLALLVGCGPAPLDLTVRNKSGGEITVRMLPDHVEKPEQSPKTRALQLKPQAAGQMRIVRGDWIIRVDTVPEKKSFRRERKMWIGEDGLLTITPSRFKYRAESDYSVD